VIEVIELEGMVPVIKNCNPTTDETEFMPVLFARSFIEVFLCKLVVGRHFTSGKL
jgi:hypothetical protein